MCGGLSFQLFGDFVRSASAEENTDRVLFRGCHHHDMQRPAFGFPCADLLFQSNLIDKIQSRFSGCSQLLQYNAFASFASTDIGDVDPLDK
jgi:hypothetical protein